jgi:hypothetical protein
MPNALITPAVVLNEGLMHLENEMVLGAMISNDYSDQFQAVGNTINIRRPAQYRVIKNNLDISGAAQDIQQATVPVTLTKTATIPVVLTALERTLSFDRLSEDIIKPAMIQLKDEIEQSIAGEYWKFYNFSGTPGTVPSTFLSLANAGAMMDDLAVPMSGRVAVHAPQAAANLADGLKGVFVQSIAKTALEKAKFGDYANFDNYKSQHTPTHTVGVATGTPLVNGGSQNVTYAASKNTWTQTLNTDGWTNSTANILRQGDVFTIAGVFSVNPVSKQSTGRLQHFTVMANATSGASTGPAALTISPPIITGAGDDAAFQTVTAAPADNAAITVVTGAGGAQHRQSLLMHPSAMTLVSRALDIPQGQGVRTVTKTGNRVTVSCTEFVDGNTLRQTMRFDMLYETLVIDPRLGMRLTN